MEGHLREEPDKPSEGSGAGGSFFWNPQPLHPNSDSHLTPEPCSQLASVWGGAPKMESVSFQLHPHPREKG